MGTSTSSKGPGPGVPMVPPWADPPNSDVPNVDIDADDPPKPQRSVPPSPVAPNRRFANSRVSMGSFARTGDTNDLRGGLKGYVSKGYGGASTATRRMGGTAQIASVLSDALSTGQSSSASNDQSGSESTERVNSADEVISQIVEAVAPVDGSQDSEVSRESIREVLSEVIEEHPDTDLLDLDDDARQSVVEKYIATDIYRRIVLDIGKKIQDASPSAKVGLQRLRQVKDYVRSTVKSAFRTAGSSGASSASANMSKIASNTIKTTFEVFESYAK